MESEGPQNQALNSNSTESSKAGQPSSPGIKNKLFPIIIILLIVLVGGGIWWWTHQNTISTNNAKVAADLIEISPKQTGRIQAILVEEQSLVAADQILFQLESEQLRAELLRSEANLELAKASLNKLLNGARPEEKMQIQAVLVQTEAGVEKAHAQIAKVEADVKDKERIMKERETLFVEGGISSESLELAKSDYQKSLSDLASAQASLTEAKNKNVEIKARQSLIESPPLADDLQIAEAQVKQAEAALLIAQSNYNGSFIKAPCAGIIARISAQAGETLNPGQSAITMVDLSKVWIQANLDETDLQGLIPGVKVEVTIDSYPGVVFVGKLSEIGLASGSVFALIPTDNSAGNFTKVVQRFSVKIDLDPAGYTLRPGMSAVVKIYRS